jgi:hypothetical protein
MNACGLRKILCLAWILAALFISAACGSGGAKWGEHKYPEGFSLRHPDGWNAQVVEKAYILVSSPETAEDAGFLLVYPFFLKNMSQAGAWLEQNLSALSNFFPAAAIEQKRQIRSQPDEWAAKFRFQKNGVPFTGLALCSIYERSGILYAAASKMDSFEKNRESLLKMLESFQFGEPESTSEKTQPAPRIQYVNWQDPAEQAFMLDVPRGWQIQGGTYRRASVDLVHVLQALSPDQKIRIQFNDANLPVFAIPNQMLAFSGFQEGSWYSPGYGVRMLVRRYSPGLNFLSEYLQQNYKPRLNQFEMVSQSDRPDIVANFNRIYSQFQTYGVQFTLHAGESAFRFDQNGEPFIGYGMALTQVVYMPAMQGGNWNVALLLIYTCPAADAELVKEAATHMFLSVKMNPQWEAAQQQLAGNVSQIVSQTNQEISRIINNAYWTRQGVMDNISRKFSNYILGVTDVVDPETGQTWKVEAGHNYYLGKTYGNVVVGTETFTRPDIDFSPLKELK